MPLVLSNDDGVSADGLATLHAILDPRGMPDRRAGRPAERRRARRHDLEPSDSTSTDPRRFGLGGTKPTARGSPSRLGAAVRAGDGLATKEKTPRSGSSRASTTAPTSAWTPTSRARGRRPGGGDPRLPGDRHLPVRREAPRPRLGRHRRARPAGPRGLLERPPRPGHFWNVNLPHPADEGTTSRARLLRPRPEPPRLPLRDARRRAPLGQRLPRPPAGDGTRHRRVHGRRDLDHRDPVQPPHDAPAVGKTDRRWSRTDHKFS